MRIWKGEKSIEHENRQNLFLFSVPECEEYQKQLYRNGKSQQLYCMRFSVLPVYHAVYDLSKVLFAMRREGFYVLATVHSKIPLISLILTIRKSKLRRLK